MNRNLLCVILMGLSVASALGQECRMSHAFMQPDSNAPNRERQTAVWADTGNSALFFIKTSMKTPTIYVGDEIAAT